MLWKEERVEEMKQYVLMNWFELASLGFVCVLIPVLLLWTVALVKIERHLRVIREEMEGRVWPPRDEREEHDEHLIPL